MVDEQDRVIGNYAVLGRIAFVGEAEVTRALGREATSVTLMGRCGNIFAFAVSPINLLLRGGKRAVAGGVFVEPQDVDAHH